MIPPVNASRTGASPTIAGPTLGKNDFLKLLITQLKNQDPLNPLDQNQFLAQTAQFTSLENLQNIGSQLAEMKQLSASGSLAQAAALLGKTASSSGRDFVLGNSPADLPFALDSAASVRLDILDGQGSVVRTLATASLPPGAHAVTWDGRDSTGRSLTPGTYHYRVKPDAGAVAVAIRGTLTGLSPDGASMRYRIGDVVIRPDDLIDLR